MTLRTRIALFAIFLSGCGGGGGSDAGIPSDASATVDSAAAMDLGMTDLSMTDLAVAMADPKRGEYLVKSLLFCGDCHTTPDGNGNPSTDPALYLAGGRVFNVSDADGGVNQVYAANLTSDVTTGVGGWTAIAIKNALINGRDKEGNALSPIMPYPVYSNLTALDALSIALYVQTLPAHSNQVPDNTVNTAAPAPLVDGTQVPHTTVAANDPIFAGAERGRYLATLACLSCHTPKVGGAIDFTRAFAGGRIFAVGNDRSISGNLTPSLTGIASWSTTDIAATLSTNREQGVGRILCAPMPGGPSGFGNLTAGDLDDLAQFVHTLPPIANGPFGCTDAGVAYGIADGG